MLLHLVYFLCIGCRVSARNLQKKRGHAAVHVSPPPQFPANQARERHSWARQGGIQVLRNHLRGEGGFALIMFDYGRGEGGSGRDYVITEGEERGGGEEEERRRKGKRKGKRGGDPIGFCSFYVVGTDFLFSPSWHAAGGGNFFL